jgi:hypothetical protein
MYKIVARQFPNDETRITMSSVPGGRDPFKVAPTAAKTPLVNPAPDPADDGLICSEEESPAPLSLVSNSKTQRSSAGYGLLPTKPTRFGLNAKRKLLRAGGALEKVAPPEETLFLTGTLPGSTEDSFRSIAAYSGYIVNSLKAWIANYAPQKLDFYVWEYQKRGALHLHYAVHIPCGIARDHIIKSFHGWWVSSLHRIGENAKVDMFRKNAGKTWLGDESKVRAVAEVCRKSVARYLAKYLSKSATPTRGPARAFSPSRWWGVSRPLKALTDSMTSVVEIATAGYHAIRGIWEKVKTSCDTSEGVTYSYRHNVGAGETIVGYHSDKSEREHLWTELSAMTIQTRGVSQSHSQPPSQALLVLRNAQATWLRESLTSLPPTWLGLRASLEANLNWILKITPSSSAEPLPIILAWAAKLSDIRYLCQFTPAMTRSQENQIQTWLDVLERSIEDIALNGWH